jgi:assimilatory nitrate reductase catalytic subunit
VTVSGDKSHPANFGRLCSKGTALDQTLDIEGRLLYPIVDGRRATWDDALNRVADGFKKIIAEHGPDAVAFYVSGQLLTEDYYVANKLMKGFIGSANIDTNSRLCMSSAVAAHKRAFGADAVPVCYEDVELADLVVLVGSNYAWAHPVLYQRLAAAKKARPEMQVVVVDPRRTATCDIADLHLAIAPGADAFLFNGLLHHLRREDAIDLNFVEAHVEGFAAAFEAARSVNSIPRVAQVCGIPETDVSEFFRLFAKTERTVTVFSQGINQSSSGVDKGNAIINVHLATSRIGKAGMGPFSVTGQPNAMGGREVGGLANQLAAHMDFSDAASVDRVARFWNAKNIAQAPGLKAVDMFQAVASGKIKGIWIMGTNPVVSMPDADKVRAALMACELVVVSDCVQHTDTTACADILLPASGWGEKDGTVTNSERRISRQRSVLITNGSLEPNSLLPPCRGGERSEGASGMGVEQRDSSVSTLSLALPLQGGELARGPDGAANGIFKFTVAGEAKADWWIITQVAQRMGFAEAFPYEKPAQIFREHARLSDFENNGARAFDISAMSDIDDAQYDALQPVQWPVRRAKSPPPPLLQRGEFDEQLQREPPFVKGGQGGLGSGGFIGMQRLFGDGRFYTPSGKARMIAVAAQLPAVATDAEFPLVLNTGRLRDQWHTMTRTGKVPRLNAHSFEPYVQMHARDAQLYQLQDGGLARLGSRHGNMLARVQVSDEQRSGSVFVPMHWSDAYARSARVDALAAAITDPISGQPELKHTPVYAEAYRPAWQGFVLSRERLALPETNYCACTRGAGYWRHEIAGETLPDDWRHWVRAALNHGGEWLEYRDTAMGRYRAACLQDGRLDAVFFLAPDQRLPEREWLGSLFGQEALQPSELAGLLSARPPNGVESDTGPIVCACFSVGRKTISGAIRARSLASVEAVGACLKAGTNCGSCIPEIHRILADSA